VSSPKSFDEIDDTELALKFGKQLACGTTGAEPCPLLVSATLPRSVRSGLSLHPRRYDQYCPIAGALDLVGERWTLLIVRELLLGPARFTDLRTGLPGVPPNLLSTRLRELEAEGLVARRELPPPAARTVYELTEDGRALEPVLRALVRWGMSRMAPPDGIDLDPGAAVRSALWAARTPRAALAPRR